MGRATAPTPAYRDDPDAVSLHTTPDDYAYSDAPDLGLDHAPLPPSYADSEASSAPAFTAPAPIHHLPPPTTRTNHASPSFKNGYPVVSSTLTLIDPLLDNDPVLLEKTIRANASIAPVQYIYIMGTHKETIKRGDKKETTEITDFRIVINLSPYLHPNFDPSDISTMELATVENSDKVHRGTRLRQRASRPTSDPEGAQSPKPTLTEWTHRYCASSAHLRSFRLHRVVTGLDTAFLQQRIEGLIRATNYRGHIAITFPVEDGYLVIYTDTRINRWRLTTWLRWLFYLSFLWLFAWPALFLATKRFAVVTARWPFSLAPPNDAHQSRLYTTVSEEQWVERWRVALRRLVLDRWQGEVSEEVMRGVEARPEDPGMPGVLRSGHEGVDAAVGLLSHGLQVARAVRGGGLERGLERGLQGGWGYDDC